MAGMPKKWDFWKQGWGPDEELKHLHENQIQDFYQWTKRESWTPRQAIVLSLGLEPKTLISPEGLMLLTDVSVVKDYISNLHEQISKAQENSQLPPDRFHPRVYLDWAEKNGIDLPPDLLRLVPHSGGGSYPALGP